MKTSTTTERLTQMTEGLADDYGLTARAFELIALAGEYRRHGIETPGAARGLDRLADQAMQNAAALLAAEGSRGRHAGMAGPGHARPEGHGRRA